jgi:hypothetical protein
MHDPRSCGHKPPTWLLASIQGSSRPHSAAITATAARLTPATAAAARAHAASDTAHTAACMSGKRNQSMSKVEADHGVSVGWVILLQSEKFKGASRVITWLGDRVAVMRGFGFVRGGGGPQNIRCRFVRTPRIALSLSCAAVWRHSSSGGCAAGRRDARIRAPAHHAGDWTACAWDGTCM